MTGPIDTGGGPAHGQRQPRLGLGDADVKEPVVEAFGLAGRLDQAWERSPGFAEPAFDDIEDEEVDFGAMDPRRELCPPSQFQPALRKRPGLLEVHQFAHGAAPHVHRSSRITRQDLPFEA